MDKLLTKQQVADYFGCSVRTIESMKAAGKIPFVKIGHFVRFRESDIENTVVKNVGTLGPKMPETTRKDPKAFPEDSGTYGPLRPVS